MCSYSSRTPMLFAALVSLHRSLAGKEEMRSAPSSGGARPGLPLLASDWRDQG